MKLFLLFFGSIVLIDAVENQCPPREYSSELVELVRGFDLIRICDVAQAKSLAEYWSDGLSRRHFFACMMFYYYGKDSGVPCHAFRASVGKDIFELQYASAQSTPIPDEQSCKTNCKCHIAYNVSKEKFWAPHLVEKCAELCSVHFNSVFTMEDEKRKAYEVEVYKLLQKKEQLQAYLNH